MDIVVNTAELASVATKLGAAGEGGVIGHLRQRANLLTEVAGQTKTELRGGYGKTGGFQHSLDVLPREFTDLLVEFNVQHEAFIAFLEGLRDRMNTAAGLYHDAEQRNVSRFGAITDRLDPDRGVR